MLRSSNDKRDLRPAAGSTPPADAPKRTRNRSRRSGARRRRGAAVAEFAIVAPVFFLMVVGFIEFGRALMVQQVLVNAARVGARQAITTSASTSSVESAVADYAAGIIYRFSR